MDDADLKRLLTGMDDDDVRALVEDMPPHLLQPLIASTNPARRSVPASPLAQALELDPGYRARDHLVYLSDRLTRAVRDVEAGRSRFLKVSMPPRSGKSVLTSMFLPVWLLLQHPDWKLGLISHDPVLAAGWGREVRSMIEQHGPVRGVKLAKDAGAVGNWQTTDGGGVVARSAPGQSLTGRGFKVLIIDDAVKDFASAHSEKAREALWEWWTSNAFTRLEPPYLVIVVGTRWHQDDLIGRLASREYAGDPDDWEVIEFPAIATDNDVLGREPGDPLLSPLLTETREEAVARWRSVEAAVGRYMFAALYQQSPSPAKGAIFDVDSIRYWTSDPAHVSDHVHYLDPDRLPGMLWLDSWDMAFKALDTSDFVVGQRWAMGYPFRYLMAQTRGRRTFNESLAEVKRWCDPHLTPYAGHVHKRLIEEKANGAAIIDSLRKHVSGIKPVNPTDSKEARMWAVTPEVESGHVLLPYPGDPGNEWVGDLIGELREAPNGAHDDQVDAFTQALMELRVSARARLATPPGSPELQPGVRSRNGSSRVAAARSMRRAGTLGR